MRTPQKITLSFRLVGTPAKKRTMYRWLKALEKDGTLASEIEALFETETAFYTPEELALRYGMKPEDFEETG